MRCREMFEAYLNDGTVVPFEDAAVIDVTSFACSFRADSGEQLGTVPLVNILFVRKGDSNA